MLHTPLSARVARCRPTVVRLTLAVAVASCAVVGAQQAEPRRGAAPRGLPPVPLPDGPFVFETFEQPRIRAVVVTKGLSRPWGMAFLPGGEILVTEKDGRLRVIRDGGLDPTPIPGVPEVVQGARFAGLMDVALHPRFAENGLVYLSYTKPLDDGATVALARGHFDGRALTDVSDVFVADPWGGLVSACRLRFAPDGTLFMSVGGAFGGQRQLAQDPGVHAGKLLRLRDDGTVPPDNPFVGRAGYKPEIYSMGHRNQHGLAFHPETGELWAAEHGVQGGDEVNIIQPGRNYGWPDVSHSREYFGPQVSSRPWSETSAGPAIVWIPSIGPSGMTFYTGSAFPQWQGNLFVGALTTGRVPRTGHVERIVLNREGQELRREWLLGPLQQRIRDVAQGPDGLLYVLTEEIDAALLRIEPVE